MTSPNGPNDPNIPGPPDPEIGKAIFVVTLPFFIIFAIPLIRWAALVLQRAWGL